MNLNPSKGGVNCLHDGEHTDNNGNIIDCYCGECEHYLICFGHEVEEYFINEIERRKPK